MMASFHPRGMEETISRIKHRGQRNSPGLALIGILTINPAV
jgi:hypothetical protein